MDYKVARVYRGTAVLLFLFLATMAIMVKQSEALPPGCVPCNAAEHPNVQKVKHICRACAAAKGKEYENCCLCNQVIYDQCQAALATVLPEGCRSCDTRSHPNLLAVQKTCNECGSQYGPHWENCCLCQQDIYDKCVIATTK